MFRPVCWCLFLFFLIFSSCDSSYAASQGTIEGRVLTAGSRDSVAGAQIVLTVAGRGSVYRGESDAQGLFRFPTVESGEYRLRAEAPGYFPIEQDIILKPRQVLSLTFELSLRRAENTRIEVHAFSTDLDTAQTGSSRVLTRRVLEALPSPLTRDVPTLVENVVPGAILSHDNFVHLRGNELSLHQFVNGVSFLDNAHQQFVPGLSPQIFESVNFITGGFPAEFGNRFGGVLDITTRSGRTLNGHGSATLGIGTVSQDDAAVDYGGSVGRWGYYFYVGGFRSRRFLNPPVRQESHDFGHGLRGTIQLDYQGEKNIWKLLLTGGGTNFELPNTPDETLEGRDASRRLRSQTAILSWQHIFSSRALLATSLYERNVSDRLLPTADPVTPFGQGSRSTQTTGVKTDFTYARAGHTLKTGLDLTQLRLRESFRFDPRDPDDPVGPLFFRGRDLGGQVSFYVQDHFSPFRNFTIDAGVRWDQINLVGSYYQVSPRVGIAYNIPATGSVVHFAYNRLFVPPPLEYVVLASFLGNAPSDPDERVGNVQPYRQNYFEVGWAQRLHSKVTLEVNAYTHRGKNAFETSEISNTRLFLPTNFRKGRANGAEASIVLKQLERIGLSGRFQYAVARVRFFGPVSGGFAGDEELEPGERILPAFDQTHTGTASIFYRNRWRNFWSAFNFRYGGGTPAEEEIDVSSVTFHRVSRLPQHFTADFGSGISVWQKDSSRLDFEFNVTNLSNNIYRIAKESETTPIQFAPRRVIWGRVTWRF